MEKWKNILLKLSIFYSGIVLVVAATTFLGWWIDSEPLKTSLVGSNAMNPMVAVLFMMISGAILLKNYDIIKRPIYLVVIYGCITFVALCRIVHFSVGLPFRIDHLFFGTVFGLQNDGVNYMAPTAAVLFIMISVANIAHFKNKMVLAEILLYLSFLIALFMFTGHIFNVPEFKSEVAYFPALQTTILFLLLIWAINFRRPNVGIIGLLITDFEGSRIGRYLIVFTFVVPFIIGYLRLLFQHSHYISNEFGIALVVFAYFVIFTVSLLLAVISLNKRDSQRLLTTKKIQELNERLINVNYKQQLLNQELAASNEEIRSASEKVQSANDQLEEALATIKCQNEIILKQNEEALKRSQQYLEIIFSSTQEGILLLDNEGRIILFNNAFEQLILAITSKKPAIGAYVWDITAPERAQTARQLFEFALTGQTIKQEAFVNTPSGSVVRLLRYEPVIIEEKIKYVTIISTDITEQKDIAKKLETQYEELQKTNYELDRFVYSVSHDLRAPLSSILGLVNVAEMENNSKELPYLVLIKDRIKHLDGFIKSILDYSRNARTVITPSLMPIRIVIQETMDSLQTMNGFNSLNIQINLHEAVPFYSDLVRFSIIISNLITNAIKFQDYNKERSYLQLDIEVTEQTLRLVASDNGIGIAPDHLHKVFEMFYRGTDRASGSGIGLYLVKQTVEKMKGSITVTSELNNYTVFEIVLPNMVSG